jgi:hypothetical protein
VDSGLEHRERSRIFDYDIRAKAQFGSSTTVRNERNRIKIKQEVDSYRSTGNPAEVTYQQLLREARENSDRPNDNGHEFQTRKEQLVLSHPHVDFIGRKTAGGSYVEWHGPLSPLKLRAPDFDRPDGTYEYPSFDSSTLKNVGSTLINRAIPTQPHASLAQALAELKDGLPSIPLLSVLRGKGSATSIGSDDFLNYSFGIKPLISDILKICESVKSGNKLVKQFIKDSGKQVRRRRSLPVEDYNQATYSEYDVAPRGLSYPGADTFDVNFRSICSNFDGHSWYTRVDTTESTQRKWKFSGAFTYFLSEDDSIVGRLDRYEQLANHLLGTRITPSTLYQLAPWSWLIDWFVDIGTVIDNATLLQDDGLVLNYGYLMCENITTVKRVGYGFSFQSGEKLQPHTATVRTQSKQRWRANPYGFGITEEELNPFQWAILAALGMTKGGNTLRR